MCGSSTATHTASHTRRTRRPGSTCAAPPSINTRAHPVRLPRAAQRGGRCRARNGDRCRACRHQREGGGPSRSQRAAAARQSGMRLLGPGSGDGEGQRRRRRRGLTLIHDAGKLTRQFRPGRRFTIRFITLLARNGQPRTSARQEGKDGAEGGVGLVIKSPKGRSRSGRFCVPGVRSCASTGAVVLGRGGAPASGADSCSRAVGWAVV